ncbi:hypothetical protein C5F47_04465 [Nitrosopumilus cobalaminigenes]|uniref:Uncharacterized protein n=1 Tax=Nitrosopumilus cobalaminigenes TaxID=1470066 RepID=A0A7D5M0N1_9ARCH|nr:hypothetical protein [Nitrosopumilus cobalaminigenes]QLH02855.1 hypothetical protein C5F47_04465 [Nitrosopumilus cobalaminigenes]
MKGILLILGLILGMFIIPVQAQTTSEFGYQLHPEKLLENTEGTLQVFVTSNEMMVPKQITNLKAISSDNSIIEILEIKDGSDKYTKNILLKANNPGITSIALAAEGFSSKEISLEVFNNNNYPTQMLMKITPNVFPIDGPKYGHIVIEIATTGGIPTVTSEDIVVQLDTPHNEIIKIKDSELVISEGEYYAITEFEIIGTGDAIIFAETENMKKISSVVNILEAEKPLTLKLYTFPENYNSYSGTKGFAIVQLVDGEGIPVLSEEDIHFSLTVENPDVSINTSHDFEEINFAQKELVIEKGSYSAFTEFTPRLNLGDSTEELVQTFNIFVSVENYLTSENSITIAHDQIGSLEGDGPSITKVLPFLTTGKNEIIAVTYYETDIEVARQVGGNIGGSQSRELITVTVPVTAKENHSITFSSSEIDVVNPINPIMKKSDNVVLVFGETGPLMSEGDTIFSITDNEGIKTVTGNPIGPIEEDLGLTVEPLLPMILAEKEFPVIAYMLESENSEDGVVITGEDEDAEADPRLGVTPFIEDSVLTFSANDFIETDHVTIKKNQDYAILNMLSNKVGTTSLPYQLGGFSGTTNIISHTTDPSDIHLSFPKIILANSNTLATIQLLDSAKNPVYAKNDVIIKLVSNNENIIQIPQELTIKSGEYFAMFDINSFDEGEIELAILSEDMALTKYDIEVIDITPVLALDLLGGMNWNERLEGKLSVSIPEIETALDGFNVEWEVQGGEVLQFDETTDSNGVAIMNVMANDQETITISAIVSGNGLSSSTLSKTAQIQNIPIDEVVENVPEEQGFGLPIDMNTIIMIIIPIAVGGSLVMLKKMDKLDIITDRISFGEKIEEIKERVSDIRNR